LVLKKKKKKKKREQKEQEEKLKERREEVKNREQLNLIVQFEFNFMANFSSFYFLVSRYSWFIFFKS
jgi:hypothetical protein